MPADHVRLEPVQLEQLERLRVLPGRYLDVVALLALAEQVGAAAGIGKGTAGRNSARKKMEPILRQTVRNYVERGPAPSFSGPLVRGDVATVRLNLRALARVPGAQEVYLALARTALRTLPVRNRAALRQLLSGK